jgi:hypothetical protein
MPLAHPDVCRRVLCPCRFISFDDALAKLHYLPFEKDVRPPVPAMYDLGRRMDIRVGVYGHDGESTKSVSPQWRSLHL